MRKVTKTQAKAIARTLFGGACEYQGNVSDEPQVKCYAFMRGIFQLYIYDDTGAINVFVQNEMVGKIYTDNPLDLTFCVNIK